jgi:P-type Ca2+ transporter type 2C
MAEQRAASPRDASRDAGGGATKADWHARPIHEIERELDADIEGGLSEEEAALRHERDGPNRLPSPEGRSAWAILGAQFTSLIVLFLVAATAIAFLFGETIEGFAILVVIVINAAVGFLTEMRAEQAIDSLRKQAAPSARVMRGGQERTIDAEEIVRGDVVLLGEGDRVPADGRLAESARLQTQEAALTGESRAAEKDADADVADDAAVAERRTMAYLGTNVTTGRGRLLVTAIGVDTEVGRIGELLEETVQRDTPLERRLEQLGRALIGVVLALAAVIIVAGYLRGNDLLYMIEVGIALAIAAVPEGLPAVATMTLALGVQRMARANALVRRLPAVETLGSTTVICTDKTGTLTRNEMTVRRLVVAGRSVDVSGAGYAPDGGFEHDDRRVDATEDELLKTALTIGALCNDARMAEEDGEAMVLGDPTEGALVVAAAKAGLDLDRLRDERPRVDEIPFESDERRMVTVHELDAGERVAYAKGAPAAILERCDDRLTDDGVAPLGDDDRRRALDDADAMAADALRVLAVAYRDAPEGAATEDLDRGLTFVGLIGMIDPLRDEAARAVERCRTAGIRTVMITGDHPRTATVLAERLGIDRGLDGSELRTWEGKELEGRDEEGWRQAVADAAVFARVSPEHKLRIVEALQRGGEVVAMTGDGVNDAPALRKADIGIAMGIKGTAVAKEAAAMIIRDDDFGTIVRAVEQGRIIYANIRRFIHYLFSCNLSEIVTVFVAIMIGWPLPLFALQILWLNMITDVFPALALALEPSRAGVMQRPPRDPNEPLVNRSYVVLIAWQGLLLAAVTLVAFAIGLDRYGRGDGLDHAVTISFMTLALTQVFHAFSARSARDTAFSRRTLENRWLWGAVLLCVGLQLAAVYVPFLQTVLRTVPLGGGDWSLVLGLALAPVAVIEVVKWVQRRAVSSRHGG